MKFPAAFRAFLHALPLVLLAGPVAAAPAINKPAPLLFHLPDSGAPPWLFVMPGASAPEGVVAEILQAAAREAGRPLRYEFQPRERASESLRRGGADGALFFSVTRPPTRELVLTEPLAQLDTVLVTMQDQPLNFRLPSNLREKKLCTLTEELYPPLALLSMKGTLRQTRAKSEQAALMMLRYESCVAAVVSGPAWRWLSTRSDWSDVRVEPRPLLKENLVLGFAARERAFADTVNRALRDMRASGLLAERVNRWLAEDARTASIESTDDPMLRLGRR